jgi:hypothetical protein
MNQNVTDELEGLNGSNQPEAGNMERCMFCGQISQMIYVHGHYQCAHCHQVTVPCCNGEVAQRFDLDSLNANVVRESQTSTTR